MENKKQSTWREQSILLPPKTVYDVTFNETKPNHYHINNLSPATIYLGVSTIPSPQTYEMFVSGNGENIHGRDQGVTRIMLYNDSTQHSRIILTTFEDKFTPTILARATTGGAAAGGGSGSFDGIIRGHTAALPAGNNNIGKVVVTDMPAVEFMLDTLPPGTNNIGKVEVTKLPMLASDAQGKIGDVGVVGGLTINSMPPISLSGASVNVESFKSKNSHVHYNGTIITTVVNVTCNPPIQNIVYLLNEGDNDLYVNFDSNTPLGTGNGLNGAILLKPGEGIENMPRMCDIIKLATKTGSTTVRLLGV